ncbi:MAG: type III-A CRISPR-associated protein Cas10/Csm1 [Paludibacteraceae bacterium]|nr:type III-A CRISPR-associated protein Cas10/Csm1 [Paludibacteraceae bacterium]
MEDKIREHIYLAALLHDIGKFYQRADKGFSDKTNELSNSVKSVADYLCPMNENGYFGYQHTVWTLQFLSEIEATLKKIPDFSQNLFDGEKNQDTIFQLASFHHKPSTELQALISLADWWSAGVDRRVKLEEENGDIDAIKWGKNRYKQIPLYSVFNGINEGKGKSAFGLRSLSIEEDGFFPNDVNSPQDGISQEMYENLWMGFNKDFDKLPTDTFEGFAESLLNLLKKYTWCIPSNTTDMSNVSLFDHLKTTAAFADCLYMYKQEKSDDFIYQNQRLTLKDGVQPVLLLGGDLSGIQKFIYNIASRKAAVSLKGRSFYLQLLIDSIIQRIIQHPDIKATLGHVVYSSGGKFYMLLPNTEKVKSAIKEIKGSIEQELWEQHHGQLVVNMDYVPFAYNVGGKGIDFENQKNQEIGLLWKALAEKLTSQKNQKFKNVLLNKYEEFFDVQEVGGNVKVCAVTGIESGKCEVIDDKEKGEKTYVLPIVIDQADLGKTLKDVDYIVTYRSDDSNKYMKNIVKIDVYNAGIHNYMFDQLELTDADADFRRITSADTCRVKRINNTDFLAAPLKGNGCSYGFQFYGGNKQAQKEGRDKTFEELADGSYLGVLRMDVDNLGSIFIKGLPDKDKSFSAYSTLSFMLDYFFSGYLNTIREKYKDDVKREKYKDDVNILYSGGDDVFAVGRWDKLIEFAADIRKDFAKFVGREDISISGGIAIVGDKFPIAKAAELAGEAEHNAKSNSEAKNAFNMFGETISWKDDFGYVERFKKEFVDLIKNENLSKGILHKIKTYALMIKDNKEKVKRGKREDMSYLWHTAYYLSRYMESHKKNQSVYDFCKNLRDRELLDARKYELMAVAARWAELELKENNVEQNK